LEENVCDVLNVSSFTPTDLEREQQQHQQQLCSSKEVEWNSTGRSGEDSGRQFTTFPLKAKSRSDHSLNRIIRDDNTWTFIAALQPSAGQLDLNSSCFFPTS